LINSVNKLGYDLDKEYFDIQGVYGYNGVLTNCNSQAFLNSFFTCFDGYCERNNIIAEFLRINPLLQNPLLCRANFKLIYDRNNINVNLLNENLFETEYEYSTRKNIRKAIKSGLSFKYVLGNEISSNDLKSFFKIYYHTMKRNNADNYYYFDTKYFSNISKQLREKALFVFDLFDNQVISCELVLLGSRIAYSFLGGTLSDYYRYRPNDFLKHETINLLRNKGFHNFLLGGGSEGVFNFKKTFSKSGVIPFYIGKKIHNHKIYDEVVTQWKIKNPNKVEECKNLVLKYRFK
jgi:predicted N-acyltransferase